MDIIKQIENNETYRKILNDSFGGVMYSKRKEEYNTKELLKLFNTVTESQKGLMDGIMKGVYDFIKGD